MAWVTLVGPPLNGTSVEIKNLTLGTTYVVGIYAPTDCHHSTNLTGKTVTYSHYRGNIFKSSLGEGNFAKELCIDCYTEARFRVLSNAKGDSRYSRKYKRALKKLAEENGDD